MNLNMTHAEMAAIYMATKSKICNPLVEDYRLALPTDGHDEDKFDQVIDCMTSTLDASTKCIPQYEAFDKCVNERGMFGKCKEELKTIERCILEHKSE